MTGIITVSDVDDPRIAPYRDIRERDLVGRDGMFIAEGQVVVERLLSAPAHRPVSLLIAAKRIPALLPMLNTCKVPVYAASQPVLDQIAGFALHRGILALGRTAPALGAEALLASTAADATVLVAVGIANHDNIGGIFRNAAAFGAAAVLLDHRCCEPLYRKAIRVSVGASLIVPFARFAMDQLLAMLERQRFTALALSPHQATPLRDIRRHGRTALLLGAEGPGLPDALLHGARPVAIPIVPGFDSLNVATASGIALSHLF